MPQPLYPQGKSPWYPLDRRLGGPQSWSGRGAEEKNIPNPCQDSNPRLFNPYSSVIPMKYPGSEESKDRFRITSPRPYINVHEHLLRKFSDRLK
jgi:hypothetical protein